MGSTETSTSSPSIQRRAGSCSTAPTRTASTRLVLSSCSQPKGGCVTCGRSIRLRWRSREGLSRGRSHQSARAPLSGLLRSSRSGPRTRFSGSSSSTHYPPRSSSPASLSLYDGGGVWPVVYSVSARRSNGRPRSGFLVFVAWLLAERRPRDAARLAVGFSVAFAAVVGPFLFWNPSAVWVSVSRQAPRGITPEAIWYLPLHALGYAAKPGAVYDPASVPSWANGAAVAVQVVVVAGLVALVALRRPTLEGAAALAALAPAGFLVLNKVFSAQYLLTILAGVCLAAAFTRRPLLIASLGAVAATANVLVYPIGRFWEPASALLFAASIAACGLAVRLACARLQRVPSAVVA